MDCICTYHVQEGANPQFESPECASDKIGFALLYYFHLLFYFLIYFIFSLYGFFDGSETLLMCLLVNLCIYCEKMAWCLQWSGIIQRMLHLGSFFVLFFLGVGVVWLAGWVCCMLQYSSIDAPLCRVEDTLTYSILLNSPYCTTLLSTCFFLSVDWSINVATTTPTAKCTVPRHRSKG